MMILATIVGNVFIVALVMNPQVSGASVLDATALSEAALVAAGPNGIEIALMILIGIGLPLIGWVLHKSDKAKEDQGKKIPISITYQKTFMFLWLPTLFLLGVWVYNDRAFNLIGLAFEGTLANWIGLVVAAAISVLYCAQVLRVGGSKTVAENTLKQIEGAQGVQDILPTTHAEYRMFQLISISAGITEEIMFRGFLIWGLSHYMPVWAAAGLSLMAFGLAHLYQESARAIIQVFIIGLALTIIYLLSGSLLSAIILHAAIDLGSGGMVWHARQREGAG